MLAVRIPQGLTHVRQLMGVPTEIAVVLVASVLTPLALAPWYITVAMVPLTSLVWLFAVRRTKGDPRWFPIWLRHNAYASYYRA